MRDLCRLIGWMVVDLIRSRATLEAEIWTLRQQINVLRRGAPGKLSFCAVDRMTAITAAARRDGFWIGVFIVPHDGHYRVQIDGEWVNVPEDAVVTEPNRAARTMVWPTWLDGHPLLHAGEHDLEISIVQ